LLREDRKLKVVFRELPILSRESEAAARLALVAARRGQYMPMHRALFESGNPDSAARLNAAEALAVPADNGMLNDPAITRELEANLRIARELGFDGTPSWVVGNKLLTGAVGYDQLRAAVAAARAE
jgi:protein-disulfide isomerase